MASPAPMTAAYKSALVALQQQQRARLQTLIQQTEAALHRDWQQGPAAAAALYRPVLDEYAKALNALRTAEDDAFAKLPTSWINDQGAALKSIEASVQASMTNYAGQAARTVEEAQNAALGRGLQDAEQLTQEALFPVSELGVNPDILFNRPNPDALAQFVGRAGNGHPLGDLFSNFSQEATSAARQSMLFGLATGANPKAMAQGIADAMGISRNRALVISRTEVLGSYRSAAHETYRANSDVLGYWLWSAGGSNPCSMCAGMDGTLHDLSEDLNDHPCGKCAPLPVTKGWDEILGPLGIDTSGLEETSIGRNYTSISQKFDSYSPAKQREIIGTQTGYEAYKRGELTLKDFIGVRPASDGFPSSYYQKSLKELQIPTRQARRLVEPRPDLMAKYEFGTLRYTDLGKITPDELMPVWAKQSEASRIVYQILRNGLPYDMTSHESGLLVTNLAQMLKSELPDNVRAAVERQLQALGQSVERLTLKSTRLEDITDLGAARREVRDAQIALRHAIQAVRADYSRNPQGLLSSALRDDKRITQAQAHLEAARIRMAELKTATQDALHAREPLSVEAAELQAKRDALAVQRDAAQARLDALSTQWEKLVLQQAEFDPEDDEEEIAALEAKILKTEDQQGALITKLDALDQKIATADTTIADEIHATPSDRVVKLRTKVDNAMAERENIYAQQHNLLAEQDRLVNLQNPANAEAAIRHAELQAKYDLYRQTLDKSDPEVKAYLKASEAWNKNDAIQREAKAEMERIERSMDALSLSGQKATGAWQQAKEDFDAASTKYNQARLKSDKLWRDLWSRGAVYKPELDSIAGFDLKFANPITGYTRDFREIRTPRWTPQEIANHPLVVAARERLANLDKQIADIQAQITGLEKPIKDINKGIERDLKQLREINATLSDGAKAFDTMRPFNDVIDLPEGHQLPNALMNKIDYRMHEPREVTKTRIIDNIANNLKDNPAWQAYVDRMPMPDNLGVYHGYIPNYASAKDTKSAKLLADIMRKWGVGYKPGSPMWVSMQMATNEEFGLDAEIHVVSEAGLRAGAEMYAQDGAALRAMLRAMYDNTQKWFADNGIEEAEVYRGFGWAHGVKTVSYDNAGRPIYESVNPNIPKGIEWGPMESQNYGVADMELNPFQSFSADVNISQGTGGGGGGFAGAGFSGGNDYSLLIGAKVPVDRILSTAQTGFGAKLESEVIVMGRATDTISYRAGSRIPEAILRQADEQNVGERGVLYSLSDGTQVHVAANADGTFTLSYLDGPQPKLGSLKLGGSTTYKTEQNVNKALVRMRVGNTYVAPPRELEIIGGEAEAEGAGARSALDDALNARVDNIPADASVADIQDFVKSQLPNIERVELMELDPATARLVANATSNLIPELPQVASNLWRIKAEVTYTDSLAYVPRDGLSLILNSEKWADLAGIADRAPTYAADGWWVSSTPEEIIGHEIGHLFQLNYGISNEAWESIMDRVAVAGGNPLVSTYAGNKIEESFAETFALLVYGEPTDDQLAIVREMAELLKEQGIDYNKLRSAVGVKRLDLGDIP